MKGEKIIRREIPNSSKQDGKKFRQVERIVLPLEKEKEKRIDTESDHRQNQEGTQLLVHFGIVTFKRPIAVQSEVRTGCTNKTNGIG
jgi:hypothetical protein